MVTQLQPPSLAACAHVAVCETLPTMRLVIDGRPGDREHVHCTCLCVLKYLDLFRCCSLFCFAVV